VSTNALVAGPVDTATATSGTGLIDDIVTLSTAIHEGNWVDAALAGVGTALDAVATAIDPLGSLIAWGVGWVLDHIDPLKSWLNDLTGDAGRVIGFAQTWANTSAALQEQAQVLLHRATSDLAGMYGEAVTAYQQRADHLAKAVSTLGTASAAIAGGLQLVSTLVQVVHDLVRDTISQVIGSCTSALAWAATGVGIPYAITVVSERAAALSAKISAKITGLIRSIGKLDTALTKLDDLIRDIRSAFINLGGSGRPRDVDLPLGRTYSMEDGTPHTTRHSSAQIDTRDASWHSVNDSLHDTDLFSSHGVDPPWTRDQLVEVINKPVGSLTPTEADLLTEIRRRMVTGDPDAVFQKALPHDQAQAYLDNVSTARGPAPDEVRGFVTHTPDTVHIGTPREVFDNLRLDYADTEFRARDETVRVIRYQSDNAVYDVPKAPALGGTSTDPLPFTGNGFTGSADNIVPEYKLHYAGDSTTMRDGAEMWEFTTSGTERLVGVLRDSAWVKVR
jgi:hypothetical protein